MNIVNKSRILSSILRHDPYSFGLSISKEGWVRVDDIINNVKELNSIDIIEAIVQHNNKKRYAFNDDKTLIRALQGHSLGEVKIDLQKVILTHDLYHGTNPDIVDVILKEGLKAMGRTHVHLSKDEHTAFLVGKRHSKPNKPAILIIDYKADIDFYISENGVYLTDYVDPKYLSVLTRG